MTDLSKDPRALLQSRFLEVLNLDPERPALEYKGEWYPWSYYHKVYELLDEVFRDRWPGKSLKVAVAARNRPSHAAAFVSLITMGQTVVTVNPFVSADNLKASLEKLDVPVLIADRQDWELPQVREWTERAGVVGIALSSDRNAPVALLPELAKAVREVPAANTSEVAVEMLTSGTTGEPKRIPMTYAMLETSLRGGVRSSKKTDRIEIKESAAILYAPLVHSGGLYALLFSVYEARPIVLLEKFSVEEWRRTVRAHKPKFASLVPAVIRMILDADVPREDLDSLIAVRSGTAPLDPDTHRAFEEKYGIPVLINYGATEFAGAVSGWTLPDYQKYGREKFGSVGRPLSDVTLQVVNPETGEEQPPGKEGILRIHAKRLGAGSPWVDTTDLASIDEDGFLYIHGRADDAIIRGGFKVLPEQVAEILRRHESVQDAFVVGLPDKRLGQVPAAAIELSPGKPRPSVEELEAYAREHLVSYQVPVCFKIVDELPKTVSMKVKRPEVVRLFEGE